MTYVVTDKCILCKYTDCVEVCPVDCFHEGPNCLVIDPEECIDCGLCEPECPVEAIFPDNDLDDDKMIKVNLEWSKKWPVITKKQDPMIEADKWKNVDNKFNQFKGV